LNLVLFSDVDDFLIFDCILNEVLSLEGVFKNIFCANKIWRKENNFCSKNKKL
jgi:hypothetical protein